MLSNAQVPRNKGKKTFIKRRGNWKSYSKQIFLLGSLVDVGLESAPFWPLGFILNKLSVLIFTNGLFTSYLNLAFDLSVSLADPYHIVTVNSC